MKRWFLALAFVFTASAALAQSGATVKQSGNVTPNHVPGWVTNGVIGDGGTAQDSPINTFGVTSNTTAGICVSSGRATAAGRQQLCLGAPLSSAAVISLQNYGTAVAQDLKFVINGAEVIIPTGGGGFVQYSGTLVNGHMPCWSGTSGLVVDCGVGAVSGTQYGVAVYTASDAIGSTAAMGTSQILIGQTSGIPIPRSLTGDVASLTTAGVLTLDKVNGVSYATTYTLGGVLIGNGTSAFTAVTTSNIGYCLLSQGVGIPPQFASCASGAGSAGGSNTQVQYNNATALAGDAAFTWVAPTLTIGVAGTTTGQLALATASGAGGTILVRNPLATAGYNFNLPTGAGTSGQPLISGGGGANAMTFGTLGILGGGTNCAAASGTCLDNITGFASTGYINRTGAGSYAFSSQIPVSGGGTGLAAGTSGGIPAFTATGTMTSSALLAQYGVMVGGGVGAVPATITACSNGQLIVGVTSAAPACQTMGGDISAITSGGSVTIAASAITNAKLANSAAYTLKGNFTASSAAPQDSTIGALTQKVTPAGTDLVMIQDQAASGQLKYATLTAVLGSGSYVTSIAGNTGAFTLGVGITNSTNQIILDKATSSNYQAATSNKAITADVIYPAETTITYGATTTVDFSTLSNGAVTLTGNISTLTLSNVTAGKSGVIRFIQNASGNNTWPAGGNTIFKYAGGTLPALSTAANAVDVLTYSCSTTTFCTASLLKDVRNP